MYIRCNCSIYGLISNSVNYYSLQILCSTNNSLRVFNLALATTNYALQTLSTKALLGVFHLAILASLLLPVLLPLLHVRAPLLGQLGLALQGKGWHRGFEH